MRSTVEYSVRRMTAGRARKWLVGFIVCACVGVWCDDDRQADAHGGEFKKT